MSFNEESQMPEHFQGHDETAVKTAEAGPNEPTDTTNRYEIPAWLQRRFNVKTSERGNPYLVPIESRVRECVRDSDDALAEGRARRAANESREELIEAVIDAGTTYHALLKQMVGPDRQWKADQLVLWPLSDEVGYQLFTSTNGEIELADYASYLLRADANVRNADDVAKHPGYMKSEGWVDLAYEELGEYDALYHGISGDTDYNVEAIIRKGYQSSAMLMGRKFLQGVKGSAPATSDGDNTEALNELRGRRRIAAA
jgi:hypothetical protein